MIIFIYIIAFLVALFISFLATGYIKNFAARLKILAFPRNRDLHSKPVPRLGGVAIGFGFIFVIILIYLAFPTDFRFTNQIRLGLDRQILGILIGSIVITLVGIYDDLKDLKPAKQFFWQFVATAIIVASGIGINFIRSPWGVLPLDQWTWHIFTFNDYSYTITFWSDLFTICWLVIIMNVVNWLDGLDGLAAGVTSISAVVLFILSLILGNNAATAILAIILAGSILGFLPWNFNPAKIFMGSAGSYLIGYILGILAIVSGGKLATAIIVLGLPIFDALWVVARRVISKKSPFASDRRHLHHRLIDAGFSIRNTVLILYLIALIFGILAIVDTGAEAKFVLIIWVVATLTIIGATTFVLEKKNGKLIIENRKIEIRK